MTVTIGRTMGPPFSFPVRRGPRPRAPLRDGDDSCIYIQMRPPLDPAALQAISAECACFNLRRAARAVTQEYDQALLPLGLRATQVTVLVAIARAPGAPAGRLAEALGMDKTTLSRNLTPLRRAKLIAPSAGADRRTRGMALTAKGTELLGRAIPLWEGAQDQVIQRVGTKGWASLRRDLASLTTSPSDRTV